MGAWGGTSRRLLKTARAWSFSEAEEKPLRHKGQGPYCHCRIGECCINPPDVPDGRGIGAELILKPSGMNLW